MSMENPGSAGAPGNSEVNNLLVQGFKAAKEGRRDEAYNIFCDVVRAEPNNELGWLYRAATTDDLSEAYVCLQRVLSINPDNEKAQRGIERIQSRLNSEDEGATVPAVPQVPRAPETGETARFGTDQVISGFNSQAAQRAEAVPSGQETVSFSRDEVAPLYSRAPEVPPPPPPPTYRPEYEATPGPASFQGYNQPERPDYGQEYNQPYYTSQDYAQPADEMVDEPVQPVGTGRNRRVGDDSEQTSSHRGAAAGAGLAPVFDKMAGARRKGRAAFGAGSEATGLDRVGRERARRVQFPLVILGIILALIAVVVFFLLLTRPGGGNSTDQAAVTATQGTGRATTAAGVTTAGRVTNPAVGATTAAAGATRTQGGAATTSGGAAPTSGAATPGGSSTVQVIGGTTAAGTANTPTQSQNPPPAATAAPAPPTSAPPAGTPPRAAVYTVRTGDNLTRIASQFSTSIAALRAANRTAIRGDTVYANTQIVVPVSRPNFGGKDGVILKQGETLQTLADRYKVTAEDIASLNGYANPADAKAGDAVLIP